MANIDERKVQHVQPIQQNKLSEDKTQCVNIAIKPANPGMDTGANNLPIFLHDASTTSPTQETGVADVSTLEDATQSQTANPGMDTVAEQFASLACNDPSDNRQGGQPSSLQTGSESDNQQAEQPSSLQTGKHLLSHSYSTRTITE